MVSCELEMYLASMAIIGDRAPAPFFYRSTVSEIPITSPVDSTYCKALTVSL